MLDWFTDPFSVSFMQRALVAGVLAAVLCACVGTWMVQRGLSFLGDALGHGLLPGVAIAQLCGFSLIAGATASAAVMIAGVSFVSARTRLSSDTSIGLLFVGALAVGVIIVSRSRNFAVDLTAFLFGDVLAATTSGNRWLLVAVIAVVVASILLYRPFVALCVDERKAATLGLHPRLAHTAMLVMIGIAVVASFRVVGTLLVFGFLVAPPATALLIVRRLAWAIVSAAAIAVVAVVGGLVISWHFDTAAGATIAAWTIASFALVVVIQAIASTLSGRSRGTSLGEQTTGLVTVGAARAGLERVTVCYGDVTAISDATFDLQPGTSTALIGPNGAGKSTVLNVLAGLVRPHAGVARMMNRPAYVLQHHSADASLPLRVWDAVAIGVWAQRGAWRPLGTTGRAIVDECLALLDITDLAHRQLSELSGGQRQRTLVAQALAQRADLLLLDEPFSGVDQTARERIDEAIQIELERGVTVVVSTHDVADAARAEQVLLFIDGHQRVSGPPAEVLQPDLLAAASAADDRTAPGRRARSG